MNENSSIDMSSMDEIYNVLDRAVTKSITSLENMRSSAEFTSKLKDIINTAVAKRIQVCWTRQSVKLRLDMIMKLAVSFLCIPHMSTLLFVEDKSIEILSTTQNLSLLQKIRRIIVEIFMFFVQSEIAISSTGHDNSQNAHRINICISLLQFRLSLLLPTYVTINNFAPLALNLLTQHYLAVSALSSDLQASITKLVSVLAYEMTVNPITATLRTHLADYFTWLSSHKTDLIKSCRSHEVIETISPSLRHELQHEEYSSIAHLLSVYRSKYKDRLHLLPLPYQPFQPEDAVKDVVREQIILNNDTISGSDFLVSMLSQLPRYLTLELPQLDIKQIVDDVSSGTGVSLNYGDGCNSGAGDSDCNEFLSLLMRYILVAVSRTYASGDALFVVNELYGGEGFTLRSPTASVLYAKNIIKCTLQQDRIIAEVRHMYELHAAESTSEEPLVNFECRIYTIISFRKLEEDITKDLMSLFLYIASNPEKVCHRSMSIIPFSPDITN